MRVSSTGLIHLERNRYSVPTQYAHRILSVRVYPTMINIVADGEKVAGVRRTRNRRHRERFIFPETVPMDFMTIRDQQFEAKGLLPSNPFLGALAYARERREGLEVYLNDPDVAIDTNHLERALRVIPMGRRNGMFCWTELGAQQVGMVQSLLVTCRLHDMARSEGTPQGGPLSPLLANVLLDEVDRDLQRRGHRFARYADDCNVYVRSQKAGERVLLSLRKLYDKLHLKVNEKKTEVGLVFGRKFLGYCLRRWTKGTVKIAVAPKALDTFKQRIRLITSRVGGKGMAQIAEQMQAYLPGWKSYFRLAQTPQIFKNLDSWMRHRLRAIQLKHWRRG